MSQLTGFLRSPLEPTEEQEAKDKSVSGFLGNVWGDVGEFVHGLSSLAGMTGSDILSAAKEGFTFGKAETDYYLDDIVKGVPDIAKDMWDIYKPGGKKLGDYLYQDPLSFASDALTVATLGGWGAVKGAQGLSRVGKIGTQLDDLAMGAMKLDDLSLGAKAVRTVLPGRGTPAGEFAQAPAGLRPILEPDTGIIRQVPRHLNPVRRAFQEKVLDPVLMSPLDDYTKRAAELHRGAAGKRIFSDGPTIPEAKAISEAGMKVQRFVDAADDYNANLYPGQQPLKRVYRQPVAKYHISKAADRLFGYHGTKFIRKRNEVLKELEEEVLGGKHLSKDELAKLHLVAQVLPPGSYGRIGFDDLVRQLELPEDVSRVRGAMREILQPHVARVQRLVEKGADQNVIDSARIYIEDLTERIGIDDAIARGDEVDKMAATIADLRLWIDRRMTNPLLENGDMDYVTALDRSFLPAMSSNASEMKKGMERFLKSMDDGEPDLDLAADLLGENGLQSFVAGITGGMDPKKLMADMLEAHFSVDRRGLGVQMARHAEMNGLQTPLYFPHLDASRVKQTDFLQKKTIKGMQQGTKPFLQRSMGWLYENDRYIQDPIEAYARRAAQVTKYLETQDLWNSIVRRFGRRIDWHDDFDEASEVLAYPTATRVMMSSKMKVEEEIADRLTLVNDGTITIEDAFADGIRKGLERMEIDARKEAVLGKELYAVPKVVADRLEGLTKVRMGWKARMFWDAPINVWRSMVLAGSPRWVFYNLLGNVTFLKMQGGRLADVLKLTVSKKYRKTIRELMDATPEQVRHSVQAGHFSPTTQYVTHYGAGENTAVGQAYKWLQRRKPVRTGHWVTTHMRRWNEHIETAFRDASFLSGLRHQARQKGLRDTGIRYLKSHESLRKLTQHGVDAEDASRALEEVNYFFNDYNALGPFERNVVRRFISPFYSFYKHTVKLMLAYPVSNPVRFNVLNNLFQLSREMNDIGPRPDWLEGSVPTDAMGQPAGPMDTRFFNARGMNPFTALGQPLWNFAAGQMNPFLKTAYEQIKGESTLTGEPFTAPDVVTPFGTDQAYRVDPENLTVEPTNRVAPGLVEHFTTQIPQLALLRDLYQASQGQYGARYGTGETIQMPGSEEPLFPKSGLQSLGKWLGLSTTDYNLLKYQVRRIEQEQDALRSLMATNPQLFAAAGRT